jgi:hypothetical protein
VNDDKQYGVRGPDPRNTVVKAESREAAEEMLLPGDVVMERHRWRHSLPADAESSWTEWHEVSS